MSWQHGRRSGASLQCGSGTSRVALAADRIRSIVEAALLVAGEPLGEDRLLRLFAADELPAEGRREALRTALASIEAGAVGHAYELVRVASGHRLQVRRELATWTGRVFEERPPRYSRALLETLALIVYQQPVTRGDIEEVRGVAVSASIMHTLLDRGWIRAVGQRETPGRPTMYGTTRAFLDYFNLKSLDELPPLDEIRSLIEPQLAADETDSATAGDVSAAVADEADATAEPVEAVRPTAEVVRLPVADRAGKR